MGRDDDFSEYVGARWRTLVRAAVLLGCSRHDAEDAVQTALARCFVAWSRVSRADNRDAYVYRTLVNTLRDSRRRHWWREQPARSIPDVSRRDDTTHIDLADAVERALDELTIDQRAVVVLRYFGHLTEQETATTLAIPVGTVKSRLSRALAVLSDNEHLTDQPEGGQP
jgi:RNA polymerase sigma-70 factor (sigma-E family)